MPGEWLETDAKHLTVFYHRGCPDGITGAWAIFTALPAPLQAGLRGLGGLFADGGPPPSAAEQAKVGPIFLAAACGEQPGRRQVAGRRVVYVDVVPSAGVLRWLADTAASLTVLDHHRSAASRLAILEGSTRNGPGRAVEVVFDEMRSGAQIAWDWAHGAAAAVRPAVVDYVADRDLYRHELPDSRAVSLALYTEGRTQSFCALDKLRHWTPSRRFSARGRLYGRLEARLVEQAAGAGRWGFVRTRPTGAGLKGSTYRVVAVNAPMLQTEIGAALLRAAPPCVDFALMWHAAPGGDIWVSLRATRAGVDLAQIAASIQGGRPGGGHTSAAAFTVPGSDIAAILAPEWRPRQNSFGAAGPHRPARMVKIEPSGRPPMTTKAFNQELLERADAGAELSFSEYLIEYGRRTRDALFPRADRMQELAAQEGCRVSETMFGHFGTGDDVASLVKRAGLVEGVDFGTRETKEGAERIFTARGFKRCLLSASDKEWAVEYFLCLEEASAGYSSYVQACLRRVRDGPQPPPARRAGFTVGDYPPLPRPAQRRAIAPPSDRPLPGR